MILDGQHRSTKILEPGKVTDPKQIRAWPSPSGWHCFSGPIALWWMNIFKSLPSLNHALWFGPKTYSALWFKHSIMSASQRLDFARIIERHVQMTQCTALLTWATRPWFDLVFKNLPRDNRETSNIQTNCVVGKDRNQMKVMESLSYKRE